MKKSDKLRRKSWKLITKNLILLVVLAVVAFAGVSSWFRDDPDADASGLQVTCSVPDGFEIAIVKPGDPIVASGNNATVWHNTSFDLDPEDYPFLANVSLSEITGDGISFIRPPLNQISTVAKVNESAQSTSWGASNISVEPNKQYLSFDIYFRTPEVNSKVVLDTNTYCGTTDNSTNFGNRQSGISPNSVIGAARISFVDYSGAEPARKLLWIPAPFVYYDGIDLYNNIDTTSNTHGLVYYDTDNHPISIHQDGTYNHGYYYYSGTYGSSANEHKTIALNDNPALGVTANTSMDYKLHKDVDLISFSQNETMTFSGTEYYVKHVRFNMWVEGEDPESRAAQVSGRFKSELIFKRVLQP